MRGQARASGLGADREEERARETARESKSFGRENVAGWWGGRIKQEAAISVSGRQIAYDANDWLKL